MALRLAPEKRGAGMDKGAIAALLVACAALVQPAAAEEIASQAMRVGVNHAMEATLYTPVGPGPYATILLLHTSAGLTETDRDWCAKLAREGFICIVPAFLLAHGNLKGELRKISFTTEAQPIFDDFVEIIGELNRLPKARPGATGAIGFSNGGYFALWLAAAQKVKAGVSYYGALNGAGTDPKLMRFQQAFTSQSAPVLELAGEDDTTIGKRPPHHLERILDEAHAPHLVVFYPDAEHDFDRSNSRPGNAAAAADAWRRTLEFFRTNLR